MRLFLAASAAFTLIGTFQALLTPTCQQTHQVTAGETCSTIALKYENSQADIQQWNQKLNPQFDCANLDIGDVICTNYASIGKRSDKNNELKPKPASTKKHKKPFHTTNVKKYIPAPTHASDSDKRKNNVQSGQKAGQSGQSGQFGQQSSQFDINKGGNKNDEHKPKPKPTTTKRHKKPFHTTIIKKPVPSPIHVSHKSNSNGQSGQQSDQSGINKRGDNKNSNQDQINGSERNAANNAEKKAAAKKHALKKHTTTKKHAPKKHTSVKSHISKMETDENKN